MSPCSFLPPVVYYIELQTRSVQCKKITCLVLSSGYSLVCSDTEKSLLHMTMESFRKEVERRDCYSGTVLLHSLCGGTGSGLGARLCEEIRDTYPAGHILSVAVAPHGTGETPLQHYNSLLCLAWLQRYTDGVLLFQNDEVMRRVAAEKKALTMSGAQPAVSMTAMNTHIASCLAGLFYPINMLKTESGVSIGIEPWEIIRSVCPMSTMKFLHTSQICRRGTAFWDSVASSVAQTVPRVSSDGRLVSFSRGAEPLYHGMDMNRDIIVFYI
ncbi:hypothetical protein FKM82_007304 [Ascaphus truei]